MSNNISPIIRDQIVEDLQALGLRRGETVMVHSSLSQIGYVVGGPETVIRAILDVIGDEGTLVMSAFTTGLHDPTEQQKQQLSEAQLALIRENIPVFDAAITPTNLGIIPETFRAWPGVIRSSHPQVSVCAMGPKAEAITKLHPFDWGEGKASPFERLFEMNAKILLLGVGANRATMLHYAESLVPHGRRKTRHFPVIQNGKRVWVSAPDVGDDLNTYFPAIGDSYFVKPGDAKTAVVGQAKSHFVSSKGLVKFAVGYLSDALKTK